MATNELPLPEDDDEMQASSTSKYVHPFSISEDEEVSGETTPTEGDKKDLDFKKPSGANEDNKKYKKFFQMIFHLWFLKPTEYLNFF